MSHPIDAVTKCITLDYSLKKSGANLTSTMGFGLKQSVVLAGLNPFLVISELIAKPRYIAAPKSKIKIHWACAGVNWKADETYRFVFEEDFVREKIERNQGNLAFEETYTINPVPALLGRDPAPGPGVTNNTKIEFVFDRLMRLGQTGNIYLYEQTGSGLNNAQLIKQYNGGDSPDILTSFSDNHLTTFTLNTLGLLKSSTTYYVTTDDKVFRDFDELYFPKLDAGDYVFTTDSSEGEFPDLISFQMSIGTLALAFIRYRNFNAAFAAEAELTPYTFFSKTAGFTSDPVGEFDWAATSNFTWRPTLNFESLTAFESVVNFTTGAQGSFDSEFDQPDVDYIRYRNYNSALDADFDQNLIYTRIRPGVASYSALFTQLGLSDYGILDSTRSPASYLRDFENIITNGPLLVDSRGSQDTDNEYSLSITSDDANSLGSLNLVETNLTSIDVDPFKSFQSGAAQSVANEKFFVLSQHKTFQVFSSISGKLISTVTNPDNLEWGQNGSSSSSGIQSIGKLTALNNDYFLIAVDNDLSSTPTEKVYVYSTADWSLIRTFTTPVHSSSLGPTNKSFVNFGACIDICGDYALIGAPFTDISLGGGTVRQNAGIIYVYNLDTGLLERQILPNENPSDNTQFGRFFSANSNYFVHRTPPLSNPPTDFSIYNPATGSIVATIPRPSVLISHPEALYGARMSLTNDYLLITSSFGNAIDGGFEGGSGFLYNTSDWSLIRRINIGYAYDTPIFPAVSNDYCVFGIPRYPYGGIPTEPKNGRCSIYSTATGELLHTIEAPQDDTFFGSFVSANKKNVIINSVAYQGSPFPPPTYSLPHSHIFSSVTSSWDATNKVLSISGTRLNINLSIDKIVYTSPLPYVDNFNLIYTATRNSDGFVSIRFHPVIALLTDAQCNLTVTSTLTGSLTQVIPPISLVYTLNNPNAFGTPSGDAFGLSVAIEGNYAIVGAPLEDELNNGNSGKAYVFNVDTGALVYTLNNPNAFGTKVNDSFGTSVAIDSNYAIVGTPNEDDTSVVDSGAAYIFNLTTGALVHTLTNPNAVGTKAEDFFGRSVGISNNYAIVGAHGEDTATISNAGVAYIFNVTTGALVHTLTNPSPATFGIFGFNVAINGDYAIVSAYIQGKAYIYNVTTGALVHTLSGNEYFGISIDIEGNYAIIGDDLNNAYIYNVTTGVLVHTLTNPNPFGTPDADGFGESVSISGNYAIVGAKGEDETSGNNSGKAYVFDVTTGALVYTLDNPNAFGSVTDDQFGYAVSINNNKVIVGVPNEDEIVSGAVQSNSGKAYVYQIPT